MTKPVKYKIWDIKKIRKIQSTNLMLDFYVFYVVVKGWRAVR